jgi:predicted transcriptional regulator
MPTSNMKDEARQILDRLPDDATWEDLQYQIYVRQAIEAGLKDAREGKTITVEEVRQRLGLRSS